MLKRSGQVTVFLAMIVLCVCALMCGLLESARTAGTRWYFKMAAASSLDSVMSGFHRPLWDRYHLLLLEEEDREQIEAGLTYYMEEYDKENGLFPMTLESVRAEDLVYVTDSGGEPLEKEIQEYMKYGFLNQEQDFPKLLEELKSLKEADSLKALSGYYEDHAREAFLLEQSLEAIGDSLQKQRDLVKKGESQLQDWDGSGFVRTAKKLIKEMERMPGLIKNYEKRADALGRSLDETEAAYVQKKEHLSGSVMDAMEAEMDGYREYTDQDGRRRQEILLIGSQTESNIPAVQSGIDHAIEVMDYINSWEGEDEDDELDEGPLWRSVLGTFRRVKIPELEVSHGIGDKEKKGLLERVRELADFDLMSFVMPTGRTVSQAVLSSPHPLPSKEMEEGGFELPDLLHLPVRLAAAEYSGIHFNNFVDNRPLDPEYEMEYLLNGKDTDEGNLEGTVKKLLMVREGMNLIHLLSDGEKRQEAQALATVIVGASGLAPLIYVTTFFILCIWALGEALVDVRELLAGGKVPLVKGGNDWKLSLEGLLDLGRSGEFPEAGGSESGLDYEVYLKLLFMLQGAELSNYRILDLIQINIGKEQDSFQARYLVYRISGSMTAGGRYLKMKAEFDKAY